MLTDTSLIELQPSDPRWLSFLEASPEAGIFHHPAWSQLMAQTYGYRPFIAARLNSAGVVDAGIPLMEVNSPIAGRRWVSLPFTDHCIPLTTDETAQRELTERVISLAQDRNVPTVELRGVYPKVPGLRLDSEYVIHKVDLKPGVEAIYKRIHEMHRRNIRIAQGNGVLVVRGEAADQLTDFYRLHVLTRHRQGVPVQPWSFFRSLRDLLICKGYGFILLAYKDHECIAGAIFLHWKDTLTYKFGASSPADLKYRPNNLLMWTAMQWGCEHGYKTFDMGRTDLENAGLRSFKSHWGAVEQPLCYSVVAQRPYKSSNGRLTHLMELVIKNSPVWFCRLAGELLYRYVG